MMIKIVDEYFEKGCGRCDRFDTPDCSTKKWMQGIEDLRRICLETGLEEVAKWGHPTYMHSGRNIVVMGAHREDFRLCFFNPALMKDPNGALKKQGPNTRYPDMFFFTNTDDVVKQEHIIRAYLVEAMGYAAAGIKQKKIEYDLEMPRELSDALADDIELGDAFNALTPGRQRSYIFNLNGAKKTETRINRIAKFRDKIIAGKGALER